MHELYMRAQVLVMRSYVVYIYYLNISAYESALHFYGVYIYTYIYFRIQYFFYKYSKQSYPFTCITAYMYYICIEMCYVMYLCVQVTH